MQSVMRVAAVLSSVVVLSFAWDPGEAAFDRPTGSAGTGQGPGGEPPLDYPAQCLPTGGVYSTGTVTASGSKLDNVMTPQSVGVSAGWMKMNLSAIPTGSIVNSAVCSVFCYSSTIPYVYARQIAGDPVTLPAGTLWTQATTGPSLAGANYWTLGANQWNALTFDAAGRTAIQNCLAQGWIAIGMHEFEPNPYFANCYGYNPTPGQSYRPRLYVDYTYSGPDLVVEQVYGTGANPGNNQLSGSISPTVVIRNVGAAPYPAGTLTLSVRETRPSLQLPASWPITVPSAIPTGGTISCPLTYTPVNSRPGWIEYTWSITATSTPEPNANNQSTYYCRYYSAAWSTFHINEDFRLDWGASGWTRGGTGTLWDSTRQLPPQFLYPSVPSVPGNHSELTVLTDSKAGLYQNNSDVWVRRSSAFSLAGRFMPFLSFCEKYQTEPGNDLCRVELSTDGGTTWPVQLRSVSGTNSSWPNWDTVRLDLSSYAGQASVNVRFRLQTNANTTADGWYVDNVVLASADVPDVQAVSVVLPAGSYARGTVVTPQAVLQNNGLLPASFTARFRIADGYVGTASITNLAPGVPTSFNFSPNWTSPTPGAFGTQCSTELAGDPVPGNNKATGTGVFVQLYDVSVSQILVPPAAVDSGVTVKPKARVKNIGNMQATGLSARFDIATGVPYSNTKPVPSLNAGDSFDVEFDDWLPVQRGLGFAKKCSVSYAGDMNPANDRATGTVNILVHNLTAAAITAPVGTVPAGAVVTPAATVRNTGNVREPLKAFFRIDCSPPYSESISLSAGLPYSDTSITFPNWTVVGAGPMTGRCSLYLGTEQLPADNQVSQGFTVGGVDVAVTSILTPSGSVDTSVTVAPRARVRNFGSGTATDVLVSFTIDSTPGNNVYADTVTKTILAGAESTVVFAAWAKPHAPRGYLTRCKAVATGDNNPGNDSLMGAFAIVVYPPGWHSRNPMPAGARGIKDGGWLAYDVSRARVYASRGNKQLDFFEYNPAKDSWKALAPWLPGTEGKPPSKGSAGCADGSGVVYATKGNNKQGFHRYDAAANAWLQKKDVPLGLSNKKVKGGTDIVWAYKGTVGSPYLLKGYKNEFYRYDVSGDSWQTLTPAPAGANPKWDKGSWLAYDDVNKKIYAHKAKYHEFYSYNTETDSWSGALKAMPIPGSAGSKKSKDGGCGTYLNTKIYALKGGNTAELWRYHVNGDSWGELASMPLGTSGKKVKAGADVVSDGSVLYATKGNKQNELWMYVPGAFLFDLPERSGVMAGALGIRSAAFSVMPNPLTRDFAVLRYSLPKAGVANVNVYNVAGQRVVMQALTGGSGIVNLDLRHLSDGVYLAKLVCEDFGSTQKLVVQR